MRRVLPFLLLTLATASCERPIDVQQPAPATPAAAQKVAPPDPGSLFFVGRWAVEADRCDDAAWVVTAQDVTTPGEVSCRFVQTPRGAGPVEVDATCFAQGPPERRRLRISYAESARGLLIEGAPFAPVGLVRCPGSAYPPVEPIAPGRPGGLPDDRTPVSEAPFTPQSAQGAANVLQTYFAHLEAGDYEAAWRVWSTGAVGRAAEPVAFARSFAGYDSYHANIGAPGALEGAAGSVFVRVPVQVYGRRKDGREVHLIGSATLRRSNDVPGASAEQRAWHIHRLALEPAARG